MGDMTSALPPKPSRLLEERLGVSLVEAEDLSRIEVACPLPGEGRQSSLGEFMTSEHGAGHSAHIINLARTAIERGASPEDAISQALGFAAVRDDTGRLRRVEPSEMRAEQPAAEAEKK